MIHFTVRGPTAARIISNATLLLPLEMYGLYGFKDRLHTWEGRIAFLGGSVELITPFSLRSHVVIPHVYVREFFRKNRAFRAFLQQGRSPQA